MWAKMNLRLMFRSLVLAIFILKLSSAATVSPRDYQIACTDNPTIDPNGKFKEGECKNKDHGDSCVVECINTHFTRDSDTSVHCINGKWSLGPKCLDKNEKCTLPPILHENSEFNGACYGRAHGDFCRVKCFYGFTTTNYTDELKVFCNNGIWGQVPTCEPAPKKYCTYPPKIDYNTEFKTNCNDTADGENCTLKCKDGFTTTDELKVVCYDGMWSKRPTCVMIEKKNCTNPPSIDENSEFSDGPCSDKAHNQLCTITCKDRSIPQGDPRVFCNDGTWSRVPKCEKEVESNIVEISGGTWFKAVINKTPRRGRTNDVNEYPKFLDNLLKSNSAVLKEM